MKKWNRILAAVLTLSLTAGLTACGGSTSDATANNASAADEGTVSNGSSEVYRTLDEIKESGTINIGDTIFILQTDLGRILEWM